MDLKLSFVTTCILDRIGFINILSIAISHFDLSSLLSRLVAVFPKIWLKHAYIAYILHTYVECFWLSCHLFIPFKGNLSRINKWTLSSKSINVIETQVLSGRKIRLGTNLTESSSRCLIRTNLILLNLKEGSDILLFLSQNSPSSVN